MIRPFLAAALALAATPAFPQASLYAEREFLYRLVKRLAE